MKTSDCIEIKLPKDTKYISVARLVTSGIGRELNLSIEEIEDLRVCIGEACINSIKLSSKESLNIKYIINNDKISINIEGVNKAIPESIKESAELELGILIIETLMDEVLYDDNSISITKFIHQ